MERALGVGWKLINFLQQRQLLRLQRIAARAEEVERLSVAEENGLLTFVDDQLRTEVKVLDRVLPDERFVVALIFDDAARPSFLIFSVATRSATSFTQSQTGQV